MNFNDRQRKVIESNEPNILVISPAGSGKTHCLIGAIQKYKIENPFAKCTAITFTKKATAELESRLQDPSVEISTIHSWAYRRLLTYARQFGFTVEIMEDEVIKDILYKISSSMYSYRINQFLLFSFVMGNYNLDIDDQIKKMFIRIQDKYIKFKRQNQLYDFTDLPLYLLNIINYYEIDIEDTDALFVDEFQDVDPIQLQLFNRTTATKKFYIGDPKQSIYGFRGAVGKVFEKLENFTTYSLDTNYRSYQEILDAADTLYAEANGDFEGTILTYMLNGNHGDDNHIITGVPIETIHETNCDRGSGGYVDYLELGNDDYRKLIPMLLNSKTQILCRSNKEVKKIQNIGFDNVSTIHQAKGLEYDNVIVIDFALSTLEELNIAYVGMTRAKNNLFIVDFNEFFSCILRLSNSQLNSIKSKKRLF